MRCRCFARKAARPAGCKPVYLNGALPVCPWSVRVLSQGVYDSLPMNQPAPESVSIAAGAISALGASTCCVLPLVLVSVGVGGAWVAQLRELERFYYVFAAVAVTAFGYAFYRLYFKPAPC